MKGRRLVGDRNETISIASLKVTTVMKGRRLVGDRNCTICTLFTRFHKVNVMKGRRLVGDRNNINAF